MIRSKLGLKALTLSALVVGVMAIGASAAQANGDWTYINPSGGALKTFDSSLVPTIQISTDVAGVLHFETKGGTKVLFLCPTAKLTENVKLLEGGKTSNGKVRFEGCTTDLNGSASKPCEPHNGTEKGVIVTKEGLGLIVLHNSEPAILIEPVTGTLLATIETGEECSIGASVNVNGHVILKDCFNSGAGALEHKVTHLGEPAGLTGELTALGQPATLLGSVFAFLTGAHENFKWAILHLN